MLNERIIVLHGRRYVHCAEERLLDKRREKVCYINLHCANGMAMSAKVK
jgi:hypothetical protein